MNHKARELGMTRHALRRADRPVEPQPVERPRPGARWSRRRTSTRSSASCRRRPSTQVEVGNRAAAVPQHQRPGASSPEWEIGLQKTGYISEAGRCLVMQAQDGRPPADHGVPRFGRQVLAHRRCRARAPLDHRVGTPRCRRSPRAKPPALTRRRRRSARSAAVAERRRDLRRGRAAAAPASFPPAGRPAPRSTARRPACPGRRGCRRPCSARRARAPRRRAPCRTGAPARVRARARSGR